MLLPTRLSIVAALAVLAGCATQANIPAGPPGKHLVYYDGSGAAVRQFDYPDDAFCRKVEAMAGRSARCRSCRRPSATPCCGSGTTPRARKAKPAKAP